MAGPGALLVPGPGWDMAAASQVLCWLCQLACILWVRLLALQRVNVYTGGGGMFRMLTEVVGAQEAPWVLKPCL